MPRSRKGNTTNESHTKLFVGNLPCNASEQELFYLFSPFGAITEIHCLGASGSQSGQACAFVRYASEQSGKSAVQQLNGKVALRPYENAALLLLVRPAKSHGNNENSYTSYYGNSNNSNTIHPVFEIPKLVVKALPQDATANEVNIYFSSAGIRLLESETVILKDDMNPVNMASAYVAPRYMEDATRAILLLNGRRPLRTNGTFLRIGVAPEKQVKPGYNTERARMSPYNLGSYLLPAPSSGLWSNDISFEAYHQYMMVPPPGRYGSFVMPSSIEPWRSSGIYSLPSPSFTKPNTTD